MKTSAVPMVLVHLLGSQLLSPTTVLTDQDLWTTFPIVLNLTGVVTGVVNYNIRQNKTPDLIIFINYGQSCIFSFHSEKLE